MAYYRYSTGKFMQSPDDLEIKPYRADRFIDIFGEFNFTHIDSECNFFCPECREMLKCQAYKEIKCVWESFYM